MGRKQVEPRVTLFVCWYWIWEALLSLTQKGKEMCLWPVKTVAEPGKVTFRISEVVYWKYFMTGETHWVRQGSSSRKHSGRADLWKWPLEGSRGHFRTWLGMKKKLYIPYKLVSVAIYAGSSSYDVDIYSRSVCSASSGHFCSFFPGSWAGALRPLLYPFPAIPIAGSV